MNVNQKTYPQIGANDFAALIPEWWAMETLREMTAKLVVLPMVNRDYEQYFANAGDVVNLNRTGSFATKRKFKDEDIVLQDATTSGDTIRLNQHLHVSFYLDDADKRSTFSNLREKFIVKAADALSGGIDQVLLGETYQFHSQVAGSVGLTSGNADAAMLDLREHFQRRNIPNNGRQLIVGPATDKLLLDVDRFVEADKLNNAAAVGAIQNGLLGRLRSFNVNEGSQVAEISAGQSTSSGAINNGDGYATGSTTLTVDTFGGALTNGSWCLINGIPYRITGASGDPCTEITISPGLHKAVADDDAVEVWDTGTINHPSGGTYAFQYGDEIQYDGIDPHPKIGQGVSFGNSDVVYTIMAVDTSNNRMLLNRPLDNAVAHGATVALFPRGNYNPAFIQDAITFVNRPLAPPSESVRSGIAVMNGIALRVTFGYDMMKMRDIVTLDTLCAVKTLDRRYGGIFIS